jgi:hypothetical protein
MKTEIREYAEHTPKSAIQAVCDDYPEFTSCSKSSKNDQHDFTLYSVEGDLVGFLSIVKKSDIRKGWAKPESLGSSVRVLRIQNQSK